MPGSSLEATESLAFSSLLRWDSGPAALCATIPGALCSFLPLLHGLCLSLCSLLPPSSPQSSSPLLLPAGLPATETPGPGHPKGVLGQSQCLWFTVCEVKEEGGPISDPSSLEVMG